jgi:hypothetical protein
MIIAMPVRCSRASVKPAGDVLPFVLTLAQFIESG